MTSLAAHSPVLWRVVQIRIVVIAQLVASALVVFAAYKSARTGSFAEQTDWVVFGIAGLTAAALVSAIWLLRARRCVATRRGRLMRTVANTFDQVGTVTETDDFGPVAAETMTHYHRAGCQLVRGKDVRSGSVIEHHRAKRTPCAVCRP